MTVSTVASPTTNVTTYWTPQWKIFRAKNRFWVFYCDGTNIVFKTSLNGTTWSGATVVRASTARNFACYRRGDYVHYVYGNGAGTDFVYRRGLLKTDGTITWTAEQNVADPTILTYDPNITVDPTGHAIITYHNQAGSIEIIKNNNTNGTWSTAWIHARASLSFGTAGRSRPLVAKNGTVYMTFVEANAINFKWETYSGGAWSGVQIGPAPTYGNRWSVAEYGGAVYFAYIVGTDVRLYNLGSGATETGLAVCVTQSHVSIIGMTDRIRLVYNSAAATVTYRDKISGVWQVAVNISAGETATALGSLTTYERSYDGYSAITWTRNTSSPYDVRHEFWAPSSGTADLRAEFRIGGASASADLLAEFITRRSDSEGLLAEFHVGQDSRQLPTEFIVKHPGSGDLKAEFIVTNSASKELASEFVVRHPGSGDLKAIFKLPLSASADLLARFEVGQSASELFARFYLMQGVDIVGPVNVTISDYDAAIRYPVQKLSFFAAGQHWIFYAYGGIMRYRTSVNGSSWSAATSIGAVTASGGMAAHFDGAYIHVSRIENNILYYRRGIPNINGSISWSAAEQTVYNNSAVGSLLHASIGVLSSGRPAISYLRYDGANYRPRVKISDNNDGTWSGSESEFTLNNTTATDWGSELFSFGSGLYVLYGRGLTTIRARQYTNSWQGEEDTGYDTRIGVTWSATLKGAEIHVAYVDDTTRDIYHGYRTSGGIWQAVSLVQIGTYTNNGVQIVSSGAALYIFWLNTNDNIINYRKSLDNGATWLDEAGNDTPQKFLDSPAAITYVYDIQVYEVKTGGHIGMMWLTGAVPPYTIYFADIGPLTATGLNLFSKFVVRHTSTKDLSATFHVGQDSRGLKGLIKVTRPGYAQLSATAIIRHSAALNLAAETVIRRSASRPLKVIFIIRNSATRDIKATTVIRHSSSSSLFAEFGITHFEDLSAEAVIRQPAFSELKSEFKVRHSTSQELKALTVVRHSASGAVLAEFNITHWRDLRAIFKIYFSGSNGLPAVFRLRQENLELSAEAVIQHSASSELMTETVIRHLASRSLKVIFIVRHSKFVRRRIYAKFKVRHTAAPLELLAIFKVTKPEAQALRAIFATSTVNATPSALFARFYVRPKYLKGEDWVIDHARRTEMKGGGEAEVKGRGLARIRDEETASSIRGSGRTQMRD